MMILTRGVILMLCMVLSRLVLSLVWLLVPASPVWGQERPVVVTVEGAGVLTVLHRGVAETIPLGGRPHNLALNPAGKPAGGTAGPAASVGPVGIGGRKLIPLPVQGKGRHGLALSPDGSRAVVAHE